MGWPLSRYLSPALAAVLFLCGSLFVVTSTETASADSSYNFREIAMAGDGQKIYVINSGGSVWKSTDSGLNWSALSSSGTRSWSAISTSQNGSVVVAAVSTGYIYVSTDSGNTWSEKTAAGSRSWRTVTVSSDGTKIRAITSNTLKLYQSDDSGVTWSENSTLPTVLNTDYNPDGTRSSNGCSNPCAVPSWAELTMSGSATKIAILATAAGPYDSGRQVFISQDGGSTWEETQVCCRDQSTVRQIASSRSDTNWTIMSGNYQSSPGYMRYDSGNNRWVRTTLTVRESAGDGTNVSTSTWKGFALAEDGDKAIFTGAYAGWVDGHKGRNESLFTGAISTELSGVFHTDSGVTYDDVAISDSGAVRAALKSSTGQFIVSTDDGATFTRVLIFTRPITPTFSTLTEYSDSYTVQVSNYDNTFTWTVATTSGTATINSTGLVTVRNPVGASTLTVYSNKTGVPEGSANYAGKDLSRNKTTAAIWAGLPPDAASDVFNGGINAIAIHPTTGELYVGGSFTDAAGISDADYIARFDGTNWQALSGPTGGLQATFSSTVQSIEFDAAGNLFAGGTFLNAGGIAAADYLAKWDGSSWSAVSDTPLTGRVNSIAISAENYLYVGGQFTNAGGVTGANYIAMLMGRDWYKCGSSTLNNSVTSVKLSDNGTLYIGGTFSNAAGIAAADYVAMLRSADWESLGSGMPDPSYTSVVLALDDTDPTDKLFVGGYFWGGVKLQGLLSFSGSTWTRIDLGFSSYVTSLKFIPKYGLFVGIAGATDNAFGRGFGILVDNDWYGVGDNLNNGSGTSSATSSSVNAIAVTSAGKIYIGGTFASTASATRSKYLATTTSWTPARLRSTTSTPVSTDSAASRAASEAERRAKVKNAREIIIQTLRNGNPISSSLAIEAELPRLTDSHTAEVNAILLAEDVETRTREVHIEKVFTKVSIIQDLTSAQPQEISVRKIVEYEIFPQGLTYGTYTLYKIKKLPLSERENIAEVMQAVEKIQESIQARKDRSARIKEKIHSRS